MSKYVDAIGLKETFCAECNHTLKCEDCDLEYHFSHFPAADVRENVRGEWVYLYEDNYKCSICGSWWCCTDSQIDEMNYCPDCGARMKPRKENDEREML